MQKSGVKFEASIREREASNPRFGFLLPGHPFHSYYRYVPSATPSPLLSGTSHQAPHPRTYLAPRHTHYMPLPR